MLPSSSRARSVDCCTRVIRVLPMRLQHPTVRWQYCSLALMCLTGFLLFELHTMQLTSGGNDATELRVSTIRAADDAATQRLTVDADRIRALEQQLQSALERVNRTELQPVLPAADVAAAAPCPQAASIRPSNPLQLPPYLSPSCTDPDVILFQRYAIQRQHAYMETREQRESGSALNPDPDPYCERERLFIDTQSATYLWSDDDLRQEMKDVAAANEQQSMNDELIAAAEAAQRLQPEHMAPRPGRRIMRESGFGIAAQLHIIAVRMLWAWQHGYTYVNIARTPWTKGVPLQPAPTFPRAATHSDRAWVPHAAPIPFRGDADYMSGRAGGRQSQSPPTLEADACQDGGWDCFFLPWTSPACIARARSLHAEFLHYPPLTDLNRATVARMERQFGVRHNADLSEFLKRKSFSSPAAIHEINRRWMEGNNAGNQRKDTAAAASPTDLAQLQRVFDFSAAVVDNPEDGLAGADPPSSDPASGAPAAATAAAGVVLNTGNPWNLPGLAFSDPAGSTAHGDLFLHAELLRFLMRPNPYMQRKLRALLQEMQFPGIKRDAGTSTAAASSEEDDADREASSSMVLSLHVRRNVEAPRATSRFVPVHRSFEYLLHVSRLVQNLGVGSVFFSTDDRSKMDLFMHSLGAGAAKDPGMGLHAMHVPHRLMGEGASIVNRETQVAGVRQITARAAAALAAQALVDEEGAMHVASLFVMGAFSRAFVGTLSSHWGRMVLEMAQWSTCAPPRQGWLMPDSSGRGLTGSSTATPSSPPRLLDFVDLDGDSYFVGDFRAIKHPRVAAYNAQDLDPSKN